MYDPRTIVIDLMILTLTSGTAFAKKPKMVVQMAAYDYTWNPAFAAETIDAYFILPDGTHVHGTCISDSMDKPRCEPESWTPEKRNPAQCQETGKNAKRCTYQETYYAERKVNDLTIWAANGKIVYHLKDSW